MPSIASVGTALPSFKYTFSDVQDVGERWLANNSDGLALFKRLTSAGNNRSRFFAVPPDGILNLNGLQNRAELFEREAPPLGQESLERALSAAGLRPADLSTFLFTSCSCPVIPSVDSLIMERLEMPRATRRIPIYQHGCAGGIIGISLAARLAQPGSKVALTSVELCSLVFHPDDHSGAQLVGSAIFGDGAASVIIDTEDKGLVIKSTESFLVPESRHLMGYETHDDGFHLRLDRQLPARLADIAPRQVKHFLLSQGLTAEEIDHWLFHPGGVKILDSLERSLCKDRRSATWARDTLTEVGNLSSASVLFVLDRFLNAKVVKHGERILMLGVGPGLTLELILFEYVES